MNVAHYEEFDMFDADTCVQCGTQLFDIAGTHAVIAGMQELFCKGACMGQRRQQQTIAFR